MEGENMKSEDLVVEEAKLHSRLRCIRRTFSVQS